jgi:hypothetical protein
VVILAVLGGAPAFATLAFFFNLYFDQTDIYQTAWLDGLMDSRFTDYLEVPQWLGTAPERPYPLGDLELDEPFRA